MFAVPFHTGKPEVTVSPSHLEQGISKWVLFNCTVVSHPMSTAPKWIKHGKELVTGDKYTISYYGVSMSTSLLVKSLTVEDTGEYVCNSSNKFGEDRASATLKVIGVCMYVCMCVYCVCVCMYSTYVCMCVCTVCMYVCVCTVRMYVCVCTVHMYVCVYTVCMYVCVCTVRMYVCI